MFRPEIGLVDQISDEDVFQEGPNSIIRGGYTQPYKTALSSSAFGIFKRSSQITGQSLLQGFLLLERRTYNMIFDEKFCCRHEIFLLFSPILHRTHLLQTKRGRDVVMSFSDFFF